MKTQRGQKNPVTAVPKLLLIWLLPLLCGATMTIADVTSFYVPEGGTIRWYDGMGGPELGSFLLAGETAEGRVTFQDRNADEVPDFIVAEGAGTDLAAVRFYDGVTFASMSPGGFLTASAPVGGIALYDVNADEVPDFIVPEGTTGPEVRAVRFYDGATLANIGGFLTDSVPVGMVTFQDRNGDEAPDFIVPEEASAAVRFYDAVSKVNFGGFFTVNAPVGKIALHDLNGDTVPDFIVPEGATGPDIAAVRFYDGVTLANMSPGGFATVEAPVGGITLYDLNADTVPDFIVPEGTAVRFYDGVTRANSVAGWGGGFVTTGNPSGGVVVLDVEVPEPSTIFILLGGAVLVGMIRRRLDC